VSVDGQKVVKGEVSGAVADAELLGIQLAHQLVEKGAKEILDEISAAVR
jgi:hydroxymethylbilane synthase